MLWGDVMTTLSKSKYTRAMQCQKMLWMDTYKSEEAEELNKESVFKTGNEVGDLAMGYFGEYSEVPFSFDKEEMCAETKRLMDEGATVIAEASFMYDDCFCSVDLLHKVGSGYDMIEVKSTTHQKDIYISDMSYQLYVLTKCGLNIKRVYNMHLNGNYVRNGELELDKLFTLEDFTEKCRTEQTSIEKNIQTTREYLSHTDETDMPLGVYCDKPYKCIYRDYCRKLHGVVEPSVFSIYRMDTKKKYELYNQGVVTFEDVLRKNVELKPNERVQIETEVNNLGPHIDREGVKEFLDLLTYPLYHLDFETYQQAIPVYDGISPYQQIPFQYSLHVQQSPCAEPEHFELLGQAGTDTRREIAEGLCRDIPRDVCVLAFNCGFEKGVIKNLAKLFPDLAEHLMDIHSNILDLAKPFQNKYYYMREMGGRYTIKEVLPALCGDDPELDYHALEGIHNGGEAMDAFPAMASMTPEEVAVKRKQLLAYCRLDTLAMVKVLEKLYDTQK